MLKDNKSNYTINFTRKTLTYLSKHTTLAEPEAVKLLIAELKTSYGYKPNLCIAYNKFCKFYRIPWNMPSYREEAKNIALPTREKIQMLIQRWKPSLNETATKHGNRTQTRRTHKTQSQRHISRPQNSQSNNSQKRQPKNHTNVPKSNTETPRTHNKEEPSPKRPTV